uniref:Uncharacterized protein n=1 Tax=Anguilla anguilla TaxID=7936 RepID=A0A0E9RNP6_ANGAN
MHICINFIMLQFILLIYFALLFNY